MSKPNKRQQILWILKGNLILWVVNLIIFALLLPLGYTPLEVISLEFFSKILFAETGVAFLVGGALAFSGSIGTTKTKEYLRKSGEPWSMDKLRQSEKRANKYLILAVFLFVESILASFLGI